MQLFNATLVLKATRSTRINQYIFVFTVMTIVYLQLSFVAIRVLTALLTMYSAEPRYNQIIFRMHLFDSSDPRKTQASFYISTVQICLVTWVLSGLAVWWVGDSDRRQRLKDYWQSWRGKTSKTKAKPKRLGPVKDKQVEWAHLSARESKCASLPKFLRSRNRKGAEAGET